MRTAFVSKARTGKDHKETAATTKTTMRAGKAGATASSGMPIFLQRARVFPKLKSGLGTSAHEQEADRASASVYSGDRTGQVRPSLTATASDGALMQGSLTDRIVASKLAESQGSGNPLPAFTREAMEEKLGADFSQVRVHTNSRANCISNALGAAAFTTGNDIYFNEDRYHPESKSGQALLAHELVHVAQQGGKNAGAVQCSMLESLTSTGLGGFELGLETRNAPAAPGMEGTIKFFPDPSGPYSTEIALIQTANVVDVGGATAPAFGAPVDWTHMNAGEEAARNEVRTPVGGTFIDIPYAAEPPGAAPTPNYERPAYIGANPTQQYLGWLRSPTDIREVSMYDYANMSFDSDLSFETVAKGTDNQVIYGSLEWGFKIRSGVVQNEYRDPHEVQSPEFNAALERFRGFYTHEPIVLYFDTDRDLPMAGELAKLSDVNSYMGRYPDVRLQVEGYADETGPAGHNLDLSLRRANNVVTILTGIGVDPARIDSLTIGHGETTALAPGSPPAAAGSLRANRRVVITFVRTASTPIVP
jgi:outer membrane protein OmpA-like peptidoglycan-associated protein